MENNNTFLIKEPVGKLMRKYSIPCIVSLLVAALYNIVDQIFISNATYLGSFGNSANTVVYPLTVVALAVAVMIGDGACSHVSISLGAGNKEESHKTIGNAILLTIIASLVIMAIYLIFMNPILTRFGARVNETTFSVSHEYFFWIALGVPFYMFGQAMNPIIRSDGSPKFAMISTLAGSILNVILDPIFIYPLHWGMMGAAIATVLGQVLTAVMAIVYLCHMKVCQLNKTSYNLKWSLIKKYIPLGFTSMVTQVSIVVVMAVSNNVLVKYGALDPIFSQVEYSAIPMAVVGIVMKFFQIIISICVGMAAGCIPVVGYNMGAKAYDRVKDVMKRLMTYEVILGLVSLIIVEVFPNYIIKIFGSANESIYYTEFAMKAFRIFLCMLPLATFNKCILIFLQGMGKAALSTILSVIREIILGVALNIILPIWLGLDGALWFMPAADAITFIATLIVVINIYKKLNTLNKEVSIN